jgi:hypothetical protein
VGSLAAAWFATRTTTEQARAQRAAEARAERKTMIVDYLRAAQELHDYAALIWEDDPNLPPHPERLRDIARLDSELWLQQKKLLLVARPPLRAASTAWTKRLDDSLVGGRPASSAVTFWDFIEPTQMRFLDAARAELEIADDAAPGPPPFRS